MFPSIHIYGTGHSGRSSRQEGVDMRYLMLVAVAGLGLTSPAWAQYPYVRPQTNPFGTPVVSPWVNLNRFGNPAVNLYGIIQPQMQLQTGLAQLQQQQQALAAGTGLTGADPNLPTTGHPTRFQNYSHYFMTQGGTGQYGAGGTYGGGQQYGQFGNQQAATAATNNPFVPPMPRVPGGR
jgi:hypothetical protein